MYSLIAMWNVNLTLKKKKKKDMWVGCFHCQAFICAG